MCNGPALKIINNHYVVLSISSSLYSPEDFIVNEIDTEGNTVTLHSTNIIPPLPITITTDTNKITNEAAEGDEVTTPTQLDTPSSPIETPPLSSLISSDSFSRVERLAIMWEEHVSVGGPLSDERVNIGRWATKNKTCIVIDVVINLVN